MIHPRAAQSCALHPTDNQYTNSDAFLTLMMIQDMCPFLMTLNSDGPFNIVLVY